MRGWIPVFLVLGVLAAQGEERRKLARAERLNGPQTLGALGELERSLREATVEILDGDSQVALGTIVRQDGLVLTKASELGWETGVRLPDGRVVVPAEVSVDPANDLAILGLEVEFDQVPRLVEAEDLERGRFLACPVSSASRICLGIVSASSRSIERQGGVLGILLGREFSQVGVEVAGVQDRTGAARAGIEAGDIIQSVEGRTVERASQLQEIVSSHLPGKILSLILKRGEGTLEMEVELGYRSDYFGHLDRNQRLSGETSVRRTGFARILQHDIPVDVRSMGGPVADLDGRFVGINIARTDRVTGFVLPSSLVRTVLADRGYPLP